MNRTSQQGLVSGLFALAAGVAGAAAPERVAQLGLFPAERDTPRALESRSDPSFPRLKLPRSSTGGLDVLKSDDAGAAILYSGTRSLPGLGSSGGQFIGGMQYSLSPNWSSIIETTIDTRAAAGRGYGFLGQVQRSLPGGFDMSLGLRYRLLENSALPQIAAFNAASLSERSWLLYPPAFGSSGSGGYELRLNYRYGERNTLGLTYGSGADADYTRQLVGMPAAEGRQFGLTGEHWLTQDWALNYGVMAQEQFGPYRGQGLRLGLRYRF